MSAATAARLVGVIPETGYLRESQIIPIIVPVSAPTLWRWVKNKQFPEPVRLGARTKAWRAEDVRAWIAAQGK